MLFKYEKDYNTIENQGRQGIWRSKNRLSEFWDTLLRGATSGQKYGWLPDGQDTWYILITSLLCQKKMAPRLVWQRCRYFVHIR